MFKILLTGANGFVGSHIAETLVEANHKVICTIRQTSNLKWIKNLQLEYKYGDLCNKKFLQEIVEDIDIVIHCAGIVRAMTKENYFKENVENTKNICKAILKNNTNLKKFVFISSQAAMGVLPVGIIKKVTDVPEPISDYGLSKIEAEKALIEVLYGKVPYTIFRPASVYGPRDKDIFMFFNLIHKHLRPVTIKKKFLQLVYVKDVAKSVLLCLENKKTDNNVYYLANPSVYTWEDIGKIISYSVGVKSLPLLVPDLAFKAMGFIMEIISKLTGKPVVLNKQKIAEILQDFWVADTFPAKTELNIKFTNLEVGSQITYNWYLKNNWF
ncbi:MAG: NAD-dependent epimerase/dehydratase family protein [Endomicrobium sp.]|jgi:nucleoside-diphosphate-sugar epimerase|nr:NAD-dependent epimerase/dehydratase family protein [Endomicrobium sp.]